MDHRHHIVLGQWAPLLLVLLLVAAATPGWGTTDPEGFSREDHLIRSTRHGQVRGLSLPASFNRTVLGFIGVPFAKPPLGPLRFRPPEDPEPWQEVLDATEEKPSCFQRPDSFFPDFPGSMERQPLSARTSEDCLYLNVYTPLGDDEVGGCRPDGSPKAVLVWVHGGKFSSGSSLPGNGRFDPEPWRADPRELAAEGCVVVVTLQYRLGSFGFLFLDHAGAPGNVGILDQRKALEWVRDNIGQFGGDPGNVTLAGQEAGATSIILHLLLTGKEEEDPAVYSAGAMLPPETTLFNRVIVQGAGVAHYPQPHLLEAREALKRALTLAKLVGCNGGPLDTENTFRASSRDQMIDCLVSKPAEEIANREVGAAPPSLNFSPFGAVNPAPSSGTSLAQMLEDRVLQDRLPPDFSMLIGSNADEGSLPLMYYLPRLFPNRDLPDAAGSLETAGDFAQTVDKLLSGKSFPHQVGDFARLLYTNWTDPDDGRHRFEAIRRLASDMEVRCPANLMASIVSKRHPVYMYEFDAKSPYDTWPNWTGTKAGDELEFLFGRPLHGLSGRSKFTRDELLLSRFMMRAWSSFVKFSDPNGAAAPSAQPTLDGPRGPVVGWPMYLEENRYVLKIATLGRKGPSTAWRPPQVQVESGLRECAFWNKLAASWPGELDSSKTRCGQNWLTGKLSEQKKLERRQGILAPETPVQGHAHDLLDVSEHRGDVHDSVHVENSVPPAGGFSKAYGSADLMTIRVSELDAPDLVPDDPDAARFLKESQKLSVAIRVLDDIDDGFSKQVSLSSWGQPSWVTYKSSVQGNAPIFVAGTQSKKVAPPGSGPPFSVAAPSSPIVSPGAKSATSTKLSGDLEVVNDPSLPTVYDPFDSESYLSSIRTWSDLQPRGSSGFSKPKGDTKPVYKYFPENHVPPIR